MKITPLELRQFEFEKTFRGYSIEEVDMFINNLAQEWERVLTETKMMRMQLELAEKEAAKLREIELTLFKTLKTAEDTSTMITEQANQQAAKNISEANVKAEKQVADAQMLAEKYVAEAKIEAEKILSDARLRANETLDQAYEKARYVKEDVLSDVRAIENDFNSLVNYKEHLLTQMRGFASATIEHVERFEEKFDIPAIESKINKANELVAVQVESEFEAVEELAEENLDSEEVEEEVTENASEEIVDTKIEEIEIGESRANEEPIEGQGADSDEGDAAVDIDDETIEDVIVATVPNLEKPHNTEDFDEESEESVDIEPGVAEGEGPKDEVINEAPLAEEIEEEIDEVIENYEDEEETKFVIDDEEDEDEEDEDEPEEPDFSVINTIKEQIVEHEISSEGEGDVTPDVALISTIPSSVNKLVADEETEYTAALGDDLTRIEGVGPKIQDILKDVGITSFRDVATTPLYKIKDHLRNAGSEYNLVDTSTWTEQALLAAEGRWDELEARQAELLGGREVAMIEKEATERVKEKFDRQVAPKAAENDTIENNLENITEEMLEKVNKVKNAIRKAMSEKKDKAEIEKESGSLPTLDDVLKRNRKKGSGSFFDNID